MGHCIRAKTKRNMAQFLFCIKLPIMFLRLIPSMVFVVPSISSCFPCFFWYDSSFCWIGFIIILIRQNMYTFPYILYSSFFVLLEKAHTYGERNKTPNTRKPRIFESISMFNDYRGPLQNP